jgi:hypothetical protein
LNSFLNDPDFKWIKYIKSIFDEIGLSFIWNDQIHIKKDLLKSIVKQKLFDQFIQTWFSQNMLDNFPLLSIRLFQNITILNFITTSINHIVRCVTSQIKYFFSKIEDVIFLFEFSNKALYALYYKLHNLTIPIDLQ